VAHPVIQIELRTDNQTCSSLLAYRASSERLVPSHGDGGADPMSRDRGCPENCPDDKHPALVGCKISADPRPATHDPCRGWPPASSHGHAYDRHIERGHREPERATNLSWIDVNYVNPLTSNATRHRLSHCQCPSCFQFPIRELNGSSCGEQHHLHQAISLHSSTSSRVWQCHCIAFWFRAG